ncbi:MAG: ABC transporter ATP-binding protein [Treponema sp.]|nr:ABC transporter ATP-binding protein [Treponema sp.]
MVHLLNVFGLSVSVKKNGKLLKILDNISFSIDEGEILGLAGESGCGKSMTALSILNLLPKDIEITGGEIFYNEQNLVKLGEKDLLKIRGSEISHVFQDVRQALNPLMKAGAQIAEMLELGAGRNKKNLKKIEIKKQVLELLVSLGFEKPEKIYNAFPHQLSGGMCQRIMTAIAVIKNPRLLIGDEPSSSLDEESQRQCLSLLKDLNHKNKMSLFIISHDLSIIRQFCSRFLIMYAGKIVEEGPSDLLFSPLHPYTQALVNAIPGKDKRGKVLENIPGKVPSIDDQLTGCPFAPRCPRAKAGCLEIFPPALQIGNRKVFCFYPATGETDE